ncbi:hypothetical protein OTSUT76_3768 [Orientia tsutsugamushi str. UT76]|nr:hypothetical protein OTSUT76_3768 [Orientia tsutsugamushi str. UT76]
MDYIEGNSIQDLSSVINEKIAAVVVKIIFNLINYFQFINF